jgi:hypothetical protein
MQAPRKLKKDIAPPHFKQESNRTSRKSAQSPQNRPKSARIELALRPRTSAPSAASPASGDPGFRIRVHPRLRREPHTNLKTNASIAYTIVAAKIPFAVLSLCELM